MTIVEQWKAEHLMSPEFQILVFATEFGLTIASANGIISFTGPDDNAIAKELAGKTFNFNFDETLPVPVITPVVVVPDVKPVVNVKPVVIPTVVNDSIKDN